MHGAFRSAPVREFPKDPVAPPSPGRNAFTL